jgi:CheY-like chemotaxis protein
VDLPRALPLALPAEGAEQTDLMASLSNATLDEVEAPATSQRFPRASLQGLVVLVVDDEPDATEWLVESLRAWGADVREATSAKEALRRIQTDHPHLVISDLAMPEMDGFSLVRELRALNTEDASIPAIALTAFARTEDARKAMLAGFQRHLSKPVNLDSLLRSISEVMAGSPRGSAGSAA